MSYKNKTYVAFDADTDIVQYRLMLAWKANKHIDFDFHNAHDLNNLRATASEDTIKAKLRQRMANTKQMVVLIGENTKNLYKFVRWEMELAIEKCIPIIAANLDSTNGATNKTPAILKNNCYFVSVPFGPNKIRYALDNFPSEYQRNKDSDPSARTYNWSMISL